MQFWIWHNIITIHHELIDLNRPVSASSNGLLKRLPIRLRPLVYKSASFLVPCCCSLSLYVVVNLICIFLVSCQLVLLLTFPKFLHSFCGQKRVYLAILLKHLISTDFNRLSCLLSFFLGVQNSLSYKRIGTANTLYTFIPLTALKYTNCKKYQKVKIFSMYY